MDLLIPFLTGLSLIASSPLLDKAEALWMASRFTESNSVLEKILASGRTDPQENAEALWRMARNYYDIGENLPMSAKVERYTLAVKIEDCGRRCMKADPKNGSCYFWTGVGIGRQGTVRGILTQMRHAKEVHDLWMTALRFQRPYRCRDGTSSVPGDYYLALGIFCRLVPDLWIVQVLLGVKGNLNTSVDSIRKAVSLEPERMEYLKELGVSLVCRGTRENRPQDIEEGKAYLMKTQTLPIIKGYDKIDKEHALLIISHPDMACDYSRDGQQKISEEEARKLIKNPSMQ